MIDTKKILHGYIESCINKLTDEEISTFIPDYSCTKFLTTAKSVKYNKLP